MHQVVLVTTQDREGLVDVAPKSNAAMVTLSGPTYGFGCQADHRTAKNIRETGEFVVNVPDVRLADVVWAMVDAPDRLSAVGLTLMRGVTVGVPRITECMAHLECALDRIVDFPNGELFIFGTVRRIDVDARCLAADDVPGRYRALGRPFFFLEPGWYAPLGEPRRVTAGQ